MGTKYNPHRLLIRVWKGTAAFKNSLVQPLSKTVWHFLKKINIEILYDLAISLLNIHPLK